MAGLGVRVQQAVIQTIDGVAHDTFWITTIDGKKVRMPGIGYRILCPTSAM